MLTAACCGCIGSSKSRCLLCRRSSVADLFCQDQIHYIVMYITMQITPRVVMTELYLKVVHIEWKMIQNSI